MNILFLGTSSGAGKTTIAAMFCRYLQKNGYDACPFKAFNLSMRSYKTPDGKELGIGQAFQAMACGKEPVPEMNPVLLRPIGNGRMELLYNGRVERITTKENPINRDESMDIIAKAYEDLSIKHEFLVCEGSGSPAELNLMETDLANVGLMRRIGVPAVLVGDIERGGVFAAIYGTWRLIPDNLKPLMKGFIINRFRGDSSVLKSGIERLEELTGMKCLGVLYKIDIRLPEEDSFSDKGSDINDANMKFLDDLDALLDEAEKSGFDFESLIKFSEK